MGIVYLGKVEKLAEEVEKHKKRINEAYYEFLGQEMYEKLERVAAKVLTPRSFFNTVDELNEYLGEKLPASSSNKLSLACVSDAKMQKNGSVKRAKFWMAPGFYISEEGFKHSGSADYSDNILASYIHEFDHFVWFACQKAPAYLLEVVVADELNPRLLPLNLNDYAEQLFQEAWPKDELLRRLKLAIISTSFNENHEKATRILDKNVLNRLGISTRLGWRHVKRQYSPIFLPNGAIAMYPTGGDPFAGETDQSLINMFLDWERSMNPVQAEEFHMNLFGSIKNLKVRKVSLEELTEIDLKKKTKKKGKK